MMNNKGFLRYEVVTILLICIIAFCGGAFFIVKNVNNQKISTMSSNGLKLSEVVVANISSFKNLNMVYLEEVINEELLNNIKNPFGGGNCDATESKVDIIDGKPYTTLRCGSYLIDKENIRDVEKTHIYKISEWSSSKIDGENIEEKVFYNCKKDGKNLYENFLEEGFLVAKINNDYDKNYYFIENLTDVCDEIVEKTFYRTKDVFK